MTPTSASSDAALLKAWGAGDKQAGELFVERHFGLVCRFFQSKLDEPVADFVHGTFEACLRKPDNYRGEGSMRAYLLSIARNQLFNLLRKRQREARALERGDLSIEAIVGSPSSEFRAHEERQLLLLALRRIPLDDQILIELHYWEGLSMIEIAEIIGAPIGTIKSRLSRARASLRVMIETSSFEGSARSSVLERLDAWAAAVRDEAPQH